MSTIFRFPNFLTRYKIVRRRKTIKRGLLRSRKALYIKHKEDARAVVHHKLLEHNLYYGFKWGRVAIKNMKSRWGSCSSKANLNFHYKVAFLPEKLLNYVIVHELCHLKAFNHSKAFWDLVAETIPDYEERRKELKKINVSKCDADSVPSVVI